MLSLAWKNAVNIRTFPTIRNGGYSDVWSEYEMFGVNMTSISSSEVKKCIFHECRRHE